MTKIKSATLDLWMNWIFFEGVVPVLFLVGMTSGQADDTCGSKKPVDKNKKWYCSVLPMYLFCF